MLFRSHETILTTRSENALGFNPLKGKTLKTCTAYAAGQPTVPRLSNMKNFIKLFTIFLALQASPPTWAQATNDNTFMVNAQLLVAARQGDVEGVKKSLAQGALPNSRNRQGKTALMMAIEKNQTAIFQLMLDAGTDVNLASLEKVTPLIAASYAGQVDMVKKLIAKGAKLEEEDRLHKSALVYAAGMGHHEVIDVLLQAGALIDAAYIDGLTPLMWAAGQGHTESVRLLVNKGANKGLKDDRGLTALDMAQEAGHAAIVPLLR